MSGGPQAPQLSLPILFSVAVFLSAFLLFLVQPMVGRMLLPLFGGAAAVWNTCLVFYQALLLLGYLHAHALSRRVRLERQWLVHGAILLVVLLTLPLRLSRHATSFDSWSPAAAVLWRLVTTVGPAFFALAGTGTLLQSWFSRSDHPSASDPYFLYAMSNLGSMLALLSYPFLVEPRLGLGAQGRDWAWSFAVLAGLTILCGWLVARSERERAATTARDEAPGAIPWRRRLEWAALVFVPTSLMMGGTLYLTTDIAPVPLLWIGPLSLYLLGYILAFARLPRSIVAGAGALAGPTVMLLLFFLLSEMRYPTWAAFALHLGALFLVAVTWLGKLAATRPARAHLTEFYLWISVGGMLAGVFNALLAPLLFKTAAEYLLVLIVAVSLMHRVRRRPGVPEVPLSAKALVAEIAVAAVLGLLCAWLVSTPAPLSRVDLTALGNLIDFPRWRVTTLLTYAIPVGLCLVCYLLGRALAFALALAAVAWICTLDNEAGQHFVRRERSFFAVLAVTDDPEGDCRHLLNGRTPHGRQFLDPAQRTTPLAFYLEEGPVGDLFRELHRSGRVGDVAVIGLGTGTIASYGRAGQRMTFYEIDPAVVRIARDPSLFTYISDSKAAVDTVLGDARLKLAEAAPGRYDLIAVDAFSSDAIPTHLLTREALALYLEKLTPRGLIAIHISNRYVDLTGLTARLAADGGLAMRVQTWGGGDGCGRFSTRWVVMAREEKDLGELATAWQPVMLPADAPLWTDEYTNLAALLSLD